MKPEVLIKKLLDNEVALEACAYTIAQLSKSNRAMRKMLEGQAVKGPPAEQQAAASAGNRFLKNVNRKIAKRA